MNGCLRFLCLLLSSALWAFAAHAAEEKPLEPHALPTQLPSKPSPEAPSKTPLSQAPPPQTPTDELSMEEWNQNDWMLVKPQIALFDLGGYLRVRSLALRRMDFGNGSPTRYPPWAEGQANYHATSIRLRLEPRLNISEQIQIFSTLDVFDNLLWGATPDTLSPLQLLSRSQHPLHRGENVLTDSITVKHLWARATFLNEQLELRLGRMPDPWGLGMFANAGDGLDCEGGTVVDRLSLTFRAVDHIFSPMLDWIARPPAHRALGAWDPQPLDPMPANDVMQYSLRISRQDTPSDIRESVAHDKTVFNYGLSNAFRFQARDLTLPYLNVGPEGPQGIPDISDPSLPITSELRDGFLYTADAFAKIYVEQLELAAEVVTQVGSLKHRPLTPAGSEPASVETVRIAKLGGALEAKYRLHGDLQGLKLALKAGGASGDSAGGFGAWNTADTRPTLSGETLIPPRLHGFQFHPDYHVDLLMFRQVLGTVTNAWYLRPEVSYQFAEKISGNLAAIYSQAMVAQKPLLLDAKTLGRPLGLELDGELFYGLKRDEAPGSHTQPLLAALAAGILMPLSAFNNPSKPAAQQRGQLAWTVQARMYVTF